MGVFADVPEIIAEQGRVKGFEQMRDRTLSNWEVLSSRLNPYSALKLVIEFDRHAMFAEVAEAKTKGAFNQELWKEYQDYLHGKVEVVPSPAGENDLVAPKGSATSGEDFEDDEPEEDEE